MLIKNYRLIPFTLLGVITNLWAIGPDLIVSRLSPPANYSSHDPGDGNIIDAFSFGGVSCNIGDEPIVFEECPSNQHPVIRGGMFRHSNGRIEQIGTSFIYHVFLASNEPDDCHGVCQNPGEAGPELRPGCSQLDPGSFTGAALYMSAASGVDAFAGSHPLNNFCGLPSGNSITYRAQVHHSDLDPATNPGALYFGQVQMVAPDDAAADNGENNVSYRKVNITYANGTYAAAVTGLTSQQQPAISAWKETDPTVLQVNARVRDEGLFIVASKATDLGNQKWRYEYAVQNINSDRSAGSFAIPLPSQIGVENVAFHDVNYHSGEIYDAADWTPVQTPSDIRWSTDSFAANPNANALRWSTLYNFRFDAQAPPTLSRATIGLFKPGTPDTIFADVVGPEHEIIDCNGNESPDLCELQCLSPFCETPCGNESDCDKNDVPDECDFVFDDVDHSGVLDMCESRGDFNGDAAINLVDFQSLAACLTGPELFVRSDCFGEDLNDDEAADLKDFSRFLRHFSSLP